MRRLRRELTYLNEYIIDKVVSDLENDNNDLDYNPQHSHQRHWYTFKNDENSIKLSFIPHPTSYPFTPKYEYMNKNKFNSFRYLVKNLKLSSLKKYHRPYFSPKFNI
jgi:hypothetical protein